MTALKKVTRIAFRRDPEPGERGARGATPRIRDYVVGVEYQAAEEGDEFQDWVFYEGQYYKCCKTHTPTGDQNPFDEIGHGYDTWELESNFQLVATKVMFAGEGSTGWLIDKGRIYHSSGKAQFAAGGDMEWGKNFKLSIDGVMNALAGVFSGRLQMKFQQISNYHTLTLEDSSSIWLQGIMITAELNLPESDDFDGWMLSVFCYPRISKMDGDAVISGRIWCPHKTTGTPGSSLDLYYASQMFMSNGGFVQLIYSKYSGCWILINESTSGIEYIRYED